MSETEDKTVDTSGSADRVKKVSVAVFGGGRKPSPDEIASPLGGALLGSILGRATGFRVTVVTDATTGEVTQYTAISGKFQAVPADTSKAPMNAGTLYLPGGFHDDMLDALAPEDATSGQRKSNGNVVDFAFDVVCIPATSKAGYAYKLVPVVERQLKGGDDVFAAIRAQADKERQKRLEAPKPGAKGKH